MTKLPFDESWNVSHEANTSSRFKEKQAKKLKIILSYKQIFLPVVLYFIVHKLATNTIS